MDRERIALEEAAHGGTSGPLREWPYLRAALERLGFPADPAMQTSGPEMRERARRALAS